MESGSWRWERGKRVGDGENIAESVIWSQGTGHRERYGLWSRGANQQDVLAPSGAVVCCG